MLEVQEAAKIITESIDPNAKVIFGAIKDDKLKKNEVKVTVIATGFPAGAMGKTVVAPLFGAVSKEREERGKIFNTLPSREEKEEVKTAPLAPALSEEKPAAKPKEDDEDDEWGAVPSFLRRPKLK
jgi:cell division protein FtsZ